MPDLSIGLSGHECLPSDERLLAMLSSAASLLSRREVRFPLRALRCPSSMHDAFPGGDMAG